MEGRRNSGISKMGFVLLNSAIGGQPPSAGAGNEGLALREERKVSKTPPLAHGTLPASRVIDLFLNVLLLRVRTGVGATMGDK